MDTRSQPENPSIDLVETANGEVTLYIDTGQAMQGWERDLMWESADMLCQYGSEFLEVGLGLGLSALRIAGNWRTAHHVVIEKHRQVIELFRDRNPSVPAALEIVHADFFDYIRAVEPSSVDGILFDPYLVPNSLWGDESLWEEVVPLLVRALRPGSVLIPCFSTRPVPRWQFARHFHQIILDRRSYTTYANTDYAPVETGSAYIQRFIKGR